MAMSVNNLAVAAGAEVYYTPAWHRMLESHMGWLRQRQDNLALSITPHDALKYSADLGGLLLRYQVPVQYHWIVMRMNHLTSPADYGEGMLQLMAPHSTVIEQLRAVFKTTHRKMK